MNTERSAASQLWSQADPPARGRAALVSAGVSASAAGLVSIDAASRAPTLRLDVGTEISAGDLVALAKLGVELLICTLPSKERTAEIHRRWALQIWEFPPADPPGESFDFGSLGESVRWWKTIRLRRRAVGTPYVGEDSLVEAESLVSLWLDESLDLDLHLSDLPALVRFHGGPIAAASAALNSQLRNLFVDFGTELPDLSVEAPITELYAVGTKVNGVELLRHPEVVKKVTVADATRVDLDTFLPCLALESLSLDRCRRLQHASALVHLPNLRALFILGAREVEHAEALLDLKVPVFTVEPNRFLDQRFQTLAETHPRWSIASQPKPPGPRATSQTSRGSGVFEIELFDGIWDASASIGSEVDIVLPDSIGLTSMLLQLIFDQVLREDEPTLATSDTVTLEIDDDILHVLSSNQAHASRAARVLSRSLTTPDRLVAIALTATHSQPPQL